MNKSLKRIITGGLAIATFLAFSFSIYANENDVTDLISDTTSSNNSEEENIITQNEYLVMTSLDQKSDSSLMKLGYSSQEISDIRDYKTNYKEHLNSLKNLDSSTLKNMEYDDNQIEVIKNLNGLESEMDLARASASVVIQFNGDLYPGSARSNATVNFWFNWKGMTSARGTDMVAIYNGAGMYYYEDQSYLNVKNYNTSSGKTTTSKIKPTMHGANNKCISFKFKTNVPYSKTCYAKSGMGRVKMTRAKMIKEVGVRVAYGKGNVSLTPSISIPPSGGISFTNGCKQMDDEFHLLK